MTYLTMSLISELHSPKFKTLVWDSEQLSSVLATVLAGFWVGHILL